MSIFWVAMKVFQVDKRYFYGQLGPIEGVMPVYRTRKEALTALGYRTDLMKVDVAMKKKRMPRK